MSTVGLTILSGLMKLYAVLINSSLHPVEVPLGEIVVESLDTGAFVWWLKSRDSEPSKPNTLMP